MKKTLIVLTLLIALSPIGVSFSSHSSDIIEYRIGESTFGVNYALEEDSLYMINIRSQNVSIYHGYPQYGSVYNIPSEGEYTVIVYEYIKDISYKRVHEETIQFAELMETRFLNSTTKVNWSSDMEAVKFFENWAPENIFMFLKYNLEYDKDFHDDKTMMYIPDIDEIYENKNGQCYEFAILYASILRSNGVECKVVQGEYGSGEIKLHHAWNEVLIDGEWKTVDLTKSIINRSGTYVNDMVVVDTEKYHKSFEY